MATFGRVRRRAWRFSGSDDLRGWKLNFEKIASLQTAKSTEWQKASKFNFEEIVNFRRRFHFLSAHPK